MARKTVISHFHNEEWLLPWWLKHHRDIFDHGIMIDYHSTDRGREIINELCPTWEIIPTRNANFEPHGVDREVMDYEAPLSGWRLALNTTEFLVGNYNYLDDRSDNARIMVGQFMLVDMERREEPFYLDPNQPIWHSRWHGYGIVNNFAQNQSHGSVPRAPRSIHNYAAGYHAVGRHFPECTPTYSDLAIFYVGYASLEPQSIERKLQIQHQCPTACHHNMDQTQLLDRFRKEQQTLSRDLRPDLAAYISAHERWLAEHQRPLQ